MTPTELHAMRLAAGIYDVPCDGCTLCCHGDAVRILPHEDASKWKTQPHPYRKDALMLAHKANHDCHYLGPTGCTIQSDKPQVCYEMDCRRIALNMTSTEARKHDKDGALPIAVWKRGRELVLKYRLEHPKEKV